LLQEEWSQLFQPIGESMISSSCNSRNAMTVNNPITDPQLTTWKRFVFVAVTTLALTRFASTMYPQHNNLHEHPALPQCIENVDTANHTLSVLEGIGRRFTANVEERPERRIITYKVDAFTQVFINGNPKTLEDLEKGMKVDVVVRGNTATRIEVGTKKAEGVTSQLVTTPPLSPLQMKTKAIPKVTTMSKPPLGSLLNTPTHTPVATPPPRTLINDIDTAKRTVTIWGGVYRRPKLCTVPLNTPILINNSSGNFEGLKKGMRVDVILSPSQVSLSRIEAFAVALPEDK
jgi:hypothetical protein